MATAPQKVTFTGPGGLKLTLDRSKVNHQDPGSDTPQMVITPFGRGTATLQCALMEGTADEAELTDKQLAWLAECEEDANAFTYQNDDQAMVRLQLRAKR